MRLFKPYTILFVVFISLFDLPLNSANIYVDNTLSQNITNGAYSIVNRDNSGSDGNAFRTVQAGIIALSAGDVLFMRGGTYYENVSIPHSIPAWRPSRFLSTPHIPQ